VPSQLNLRVPRNARGVYCVGKTPGKVNYVGRADHDLNGEIRSHDTTYHFFWFETALTPREIYAEHCRSFHKYYGMGALDSTDHPVPPERVEDRCPVCGKAPSEVASTSTKASRFAQLA